MCVAFPGKIIEINGDEAKVSFGENIMDVNIKLVDVNKGDYILAHAGYATSKIEKKDADDIFEAFNEL